MTELRRPILGWCPHVLQIRVQRGLRPSIEDSLVDCKRLVPSHHIPNTTPSDNLVLGDWRTVHPSQLYAVPIHFPTADAKYNTPERLGSLPPNRQVETWRIAPREDGEKNDWHHASSMTPDEVLWVKCFDTKVDGRARLSPHGAIQCGEDFGDARRSCEVRCVVCWEDQEAE